MKLHIRKLVGLVLLIGGSNANGIILYKYESFHYTSVMNPYSTSMSFSGYVSLDEALLPNTTYSDISSLVESFQFIDGVRRYDQSNSIGIFSMSTDEIGFPDQWLFEMANPRFQNDPGWMEGEQAWRLVFDDSGGVTRAICATVAPDSSCAFAVNQPFASSAFEGTWAVTTVPSPSPLMMFISSLLLFPFLKVNRHKSLLN